MKKLFALFGSVRLELPAYFTQSSEKLAAEFAEHALATGKPRLQRLGEKLIEIEVTAGLHHHFCNPEKEWLKLKGLLREKLAQPLSLANGEFKGYFVVTALDRSDVQLFADGTALAMNVNITFKEYAAPERGVALGLAAPQQVGEAVVTVPAGATPPLVPSFPTVPALPSVPIPLPRLPGFSLPSLPGVLNLAIAALPPAARMLVPFIRNPSLSVLRLGNFNPSINAVVSPQGVVASASLGLPGMRIGTNVRVRF